jgi:hypothetical protein
MIQILPLRTAHAIISRAVGASGRERHCDAGWIFRAGNFSTSAVATTWPSPIAVDPPIAYTDFSTAATATPCRGVDMSGKPVHVFVIRSNTETLLRTCPPDTPPTATSRPSAIATPRSLRACGSAGKVVQVLATGS